MLSYRHGFHAGNFADVHKHVALLMLLRHLIVKPAPICVIDTHAGAGTYDLESAHARKLREYEGGYARVAAAALPPPEVRDYLDCVGAAGAMDGDRRLRVYPGSPALALQLLRADDQLILSELHPTEVPLLRDRFRSEPRVSVHHRDGYEALPALVPPRQRRGLVLMDPSYELRDEFLRTTEALLLAWRKWSSGVYLVWYPVHRGQPVAVFHRKLVQGGLRKALVAELHVGHDDAPNRLAGSGILVVNPPWRFAERIKAVSDWLAPVLARDGHTPPRVAWLAPE